MAACLLGLLELLFGISIVIWLLAMPPVFRLYYSTLHLAGDRADAGAVVEWLRSDYRSRSLNLSVRKGQFRQKELEHFADVRRVLRRLPIVSMGLFGLGAMIVLTSRPRSSLLARAQRYGLICWGALLLVLGGLALWDWKALFAVLHQPFFGSRSWRLPFDSYSLQLFPMDFWRITFVVVLFCPVLLPLLLSVIVREKAANIPTSSPRPERSA